MRLFWTGFLLMGLFLIGWSTYERRLAGDGQAAPPSTMCTSEDGTPMPPPKLR
jgi:hypothetical protein